MRSKCIRWILAGLFSGWVITGCHKGIDPSPSPPPSPSALSLQKNIEELEFAHAAQSDEIAQLQAENTGQKIQLLEYESLIRDLQNRSRSQQQRLDVAIVEVVRSKARMRSLESKAEAASTIAEAEITINGLKKQVAAGGTGAHEEVLKADRLLMMSAIEFKARNFGGALYLANQAKGQAQAVQLRYNIDQAASQEDETLFATPMPLMCLKNINLRRGPGLDRKVVDTLAKGTLVMGQAYKKGWVRVKTLDGRTGWLSRSLISAP